MTSHKTTLLVVRHGETLWNAEQRFQGHGDSRLTPKGRHGAKALGRRLGEMDFDLLISSDLGRAMETAAIIAESTGHPIGVDKRLRERHYGVLEGLTIPEIQEGFPEAYERLAASDPEYVIPQGESRRQHYDRNIGFFREAIAKNEGMTLVLVAHGGVLDSLFRFVAGLPLDRPPCFISANTSLSIVSHGSFRYCARWVIETWGDVAHLEQG